MSSKNPIQNDAQCPHSPDQEERAARAWRRYKRLMCWMVVATFTAMLASFAYLNTYGGAIPIPMLVATMAGVGVSILLGTALMGLVYFSNNSGHDEAVFYKDDQNDQS